MSDESSLLIYGAPTLGVLLLTAGIAGGVMGGYSIVQQELMLCGQPTIDVADQEATEQYVGPGSPSISRLSVEELTPAERRAFREGLDSFTGEGTIEGEVAHLQEFRSGVIISYEDGQRYVTLGSINRCLDANPLLLPLGVVAMLVGTAGVLTPPIYRRFEAFESETD